MSPRSEEFMEQARDRLADAQVILETAHPAVVVSAAYYGMLYAARAALSERGEYAKTHSGTWTLFSQVFVAPGEFDQGLSALARRAKDAREQGTTRPHHLLRRRPLNTSMAPLNSLARSSGCCPTEVLPSSAG